MRILLLSWLILPLINAEVPLSDFFPYGTAKGDKKLASIDDGSSPPQNLSIAFPFFNVPQSTLWINENGIITFVRSNSQFNPFCKAGPASNRMIAPFWADVDIRHTGSIYYRQTTDTAILRKGEIEIAQAFTDEQDIHLTWAFIATWENVTYFQDLGNHNESERKINTFQATLLTDGIQGFTLFYYNEITWTTGDVSGGNNGLGGKPAEIGYDYGDNSTYFIVDDSCKDSVINITQKSNIGKPGKWTFRLGTNNISPTPQPGCQANYTGEFCVIPNTINIMGVDTLDIYGVQLTSTESAVCRFDDPGANITEIQAEIITLTHITCGRPMNLFTIGRINMDIEIFDNQDMQNASRTYKGFLYAQYPKENTLHVKIYKNQSILFTFDPQPLVDIWNIYNIASDIMSLKFFFVKLCVAAIHAVEDQAKRTAEALYYDTQCNIQGDDMFTGNVECHPHDRSVSSNLETKSFFDNICPGGDPEELACDIGWAAIVNLPEIEDPLLYLLEFGKDAMEDIDEACVPGLLGEGCKGVMNNYGNQYGRDKISSLTNETLFFPDDVPPCPPTLALAQSDPTFVVDSHCTDSSNCFYNPGAEICYISATPSPSGSAQQCCYTNSQINLKAPSAGHPFIAHPSLQAGIPNIVLDRNPFWYCCEMINQWNSSLKCKLPSDSGHNYSAPGPSLGNGDPHFTTFDKLYYTFNGAGEFWLLKNTTNQPLAVQTRMVPPSLNSGWSYFGAYALQSPNSSVLQIERINSGGFDIYYDSIPVPDNVWQNGILFDDFYISYDGSNAVVIYNNDISFKFGYWMLNTFVSNNYFGDYTQGILGSYDGNPFNDLTTPDGILLPANSTTEVIHYKFGLKWNVKKEESLFNYFGKTYEDYNIMEFRPSFGYSAGQLPANAAEICGDDQSCLWDLVTTGDATLANETRCNGEDFNNTVSTTSQNVTMCPTFSNFENGNILLENYLPGSIATFQCNNGYEIQGNIVLICLQNGKWNGSEPLCDFIPSTTITSTTADLTSTNLIPSTTEVLTTSVSREFSSSSTLSLSTTTSATTKTKTTSSSLSPTTTSKATKIKIHLTFIVLVTFLAKNFNNIAF